jgi:hypothetical protein
MEKEYVIKSKLLTFVVWCIVGGWLCYDIMSFGTL